MNPAKARARSGAATAVRLNFEKCGVLFSAKPYSFRKMNSAENPRCEASALEASFGSKVTGVRVPLQLTVADVGNRPAHPNDPEWAKTKTAQTLRYPAELRRADG